MSVRVRRLDDDKWMKQFAFFKQYVAENCCFPPARAVVDDFPLGQWYWNQRRDYQAGVLPAHRLELLDAFQPAWKESSEVRKEAEQRLFLSKDWHGNVPEGDIPLDKVLSGESLSACLQKGIYGCLQYLAFFEEAAGGMQNMERYGQKVARQFWDAKPPAGLIEKFGEEVFCRENRRNVFEAVFLNLNFDAFNVVFGVYNGYRPILGFGKGYVADAQSYNVRCKSNSPKEMLDSVHSAIRSLRGHEPEVLVLRRIEGLSYPEVGERLSLSRERIRQLERDGLRRLRAPVRSNLFAPLSNVELLAAGKGQFVCCNTTIEGDVDLRGSGCNTLPDHLMVTGSLNLENTSVETLPKRLWVGGDLVLAGTKITELPEDLVVRGNLILPEKVLEVPGSVRISGRVCQKYKESLAVEDALTSVAEIGLPAETVDVLMRNGVRTKMDFLDVEDIDALLRAAKQRSKAAPGFGIVKEELIERASERGMQ